MERNKNGLIAGLLAIALIAVVAITFYSRSRTPTESGEAAGTIGAADRHRAVQISDQDVILDIPGHAEVSAAMLELLDQGQRADLLDRIGAEARARYFADFEISEATVARMSSNQKAGLIRALETQARARIATELGMDLATMDRMDSAGLAVALDSIGSRPLLEAYGELPFVITDKVYMRMSTEQKAFVVRSLAGEARAELAAKMGTDAASLEKMDSVTLAEAVDRVGPRALEEAKGSLPFTFSDCVYMRMSAQQRFNLVRSFTTEAKAELAAAMQIDRAELERLAADELNEALGRLEGPSLLDAFGELPFTFSQQVYMRMDTGRRAGVLTALGARNMATERLSQTAFSLLNERQSMELWQRLSEQGRAAALHFTGLEKAAIDPMSLEQRTVAYERAVRQK